MASLIESVRKLHGPTLVEHDNGYDVDVICPECTRLRTEALESASSDGEGWEYAAELAHVPFPCATRVVAGTTEAEGKDDSARMRLEHLVVQREELEEHMERLDAVIGLIRRDLREDADDAEKSNDGESAKTKISQSNDTDLDAVAEGENKREDVGSDSPEQISDPADGFEF